MQRDQVKQRQAQQRAKQQASVIAASVNRPQAHGEGVFTVFTIAVDIAQIVNIQHRRRQQTAVRASADGIGNGGNDRETAEDHKTDKIGHGLPGQE